MTILALLVLVFATVMIVWLCSNGKIPPPFQWIAYAILIIVWFAVLFSVAGGLGFLDQRIR